MKRISRRVTMLLAIVSTYSVIGFAGDIHSEVVGAGSSETSQNTGEFRLASVKDGEVNRDNAIRYRQALMIAMQGLVNASMLITENKIENDGRLVKHLDALTSISVELGDAFPANTGRGSDALPSIWDEPTRFAQANTDMQNATRIWLAAAESADPNAIRKASRMAAKACRGCHERYRTPTDD